MRLPMYDFESVFLIQSRVCWRRVNLPAQLCVHKSVLVLICEGFRSVYVVHVEWPALR